jgi:hypothetical protein
LVQKLKWLVERRGLDSSAAEHRLWQVNTGNEQWGSIRGGNSWVADHLVASQEGVSSMGLMKQNIIQINNMGSTWYLCLCPVIISFRLWRNAHWAVKVASDEGFALIC